MTRQAPSAASFAKIAMTTSSGTTWFDNGYFSEENDTVYIGTRGGGLYKGTIIEK